MSRWDLSVRASLVTQWVKNPPVMQENPGQFLGQEVPWRKDRLPTPIFLGFPGGSVSKESFWFNPWVGKIAWRKVWQTTPVFLPGEFHGQRSLAGYSPQGRKESARLGD